MSVNPIGKIFLKQCFYCSKKFETKYPEEVIFCSLPCRDMQKGKEMGEKWAKKQKKYDETQLKVIERKKRIDRDKWAFKTFSEYDPTYKKTKACQG